MRNGTLARSRRTIAVLLGLAIALVAGAVPALAAPATRTELHFAFTDTESCPGFPLQATFDGWRLTRDFVDAEGTVIRTVIQVQGTLGWTSLEDPDRSVGGTTHRHIVLDYEANTFTDTGVYRNITVPGAGTVLHASGRLVAALDHDELLALSGPHETSLADFCAALGG